jgi:hypothetical protein
MLHRFVITLFQTMRCPNGTDEIVRYGKSAARVRATLRRRILELGLGRELSIQKIRKA